MGLTAILVGAGASMATLTGGLLALRLRSRQGLIVAASAGIVIGVALFDLLPEALTLGGSEFAIHYVLSAVAVGLGAYLLLSRLPTLLLWQGEKVTRQIAAATLTLHSVIDGLGIGLGFQFSWAVGVSVAAAVLSHDLADGVNVVSVSLAGDDVRNARRWLAANTIAPIAGAIIAQVAHIPKAHFAPILAGMAGIFIYIGASELLPRSQRLDRGIFAPLASLLGLASVYLVARLRG